ncbi:MAG: hypothetical protein V7L01_32305 [Nostoc sp.]
MNRRLYKNTINLNSSTGCDRSQHLSTTFRLLRVAIALRKFIQQIST